MPNHQVLDLINQNKGKVVTISGSAGCGKTSLALDWATNLIQNHYGEALYSKEIHELEHLLNESLGLMVLTNEIGFSVLHQLTNKLFTKDAYDFHPTVATYNICKIISQEATMKNICDQILAKKIKYIIIDNYEFKSESDEMEKMMASKTRNLAAFLPFCLTNNITVIALSSTRDSLNQGYPSMSIPSNLGMMASLSLKMVKPENQKSSIPCKALVSVVKNRLGPVGDVLDYEIRHK